MKFHYSLEHANKVLALLRKEVKGVKSANSELVSIEAWANCREQGYCIKVYAKSYDGGIAICFAQQRSSDSTVVIVGPMKDFNNQTNQPSESAYEDARFFGYNDDEKAAKYIAGEILKVLEPVHAAIVE
jgi:hypothetical protein